MGKKKRQSSHTSDVNNKETTMLNTTESDAKEESSCKVKSEKRFHKTQNKVGKSKCNLEVRKPKIIRFDDADNPQEVGLIITTHNKSKKTVFIDDVPQAVAVASNSRQTSVSSIQKTQQKEQEEEETVKDEDIDKFCDEILPDDNVIFENWVKLIEAKLHSKK